MRVWFLADNTSQSNPGPIFVLIVLQWTQFSWTRSCTPWKTHKEPAWKLLGCRGKPSSKVQAIRFHFHPGAKVLPQWVVWKVLFGYKATNSKAVKHPFFEWSYGYIYNYIPMDQSCTRVVGDGLYVFTKSSGSGLPWGNIICIYVMVAWPELSRTANVGLSDEIVGWSVCSECWSQPEVEGHKVLYNHHKLV